MKDDDDDDDTHIRKETLCRPLSCIIIKDEYLLNKYTTRRHIEKKKGGEISSVKENREETVFECRPGKKRNRGNRRIYLYILLF